MYRRAQPPTLELIGRALNDQCRTVLREPLPQRWIELIRSLGESECVKESLPIPHRNSRDAHASP
jgi:hypothetical protein